MVKRDIWKDKETGDYVIQNSVTSGDEHEPPGGPFYYDKEKLEKAKKRYEFVTTIQDQHVIRLKKLGKSNRVSGEELIGILKKDKESFDSKLEGIKSGFYSKLEELKSKIT